VNRLQISWITDQDASRVEHVLIKVGDAGFVDTVIDVADVIAAALREGATEINVEREEVI
jgi:hypothetical protein